ncbi:heme-binding protein [Acidipila sp. EB88]|uniref:GlcG/HbpS family heme-binding protein n=1 Tax=Acidipila sp. EB88 TaxID=2305226 RepID=UPI0013159C9C|nr:heme-binding protein [Acidipila sp. EB88]
MAPATKKYLKGLCLSLLSLTALHTVRAASLTVTAQLISEAGARQAVDTAERQAVALHAPCAVAVVDRSGILVAFLKMDGVRDGSPELAIGKARTSALLQRPSGETETNVNQGRIAFVTAGFMTLRGAVPLMSGHEVVGAIGVAGLNKDTDVTIAESAAAAFAAAATHTEPAGPPR